MTKAQVLLVEDIDDDVVLMQRAMEKAGVSFQLQVVKDGRQAIEYLEGSRKYSDRDKYPLPELVLLDLKLPQVDGLDVLKWIRTHPQLRSLIVVVLTSSNLDVDIARAYRLGASSFLLKTPSVDQLAKMVGLIEEYWLKINRPPPRDFPWRTTST